MASHTASTSENVESSSGAAAAEVESIKAGFAQLRTDVMDLLSHAFGLGKAATHVANDNAVDAVERLKARIDDIKERSADGVSTIEQKIGENPLPAALMAFGIGFVIAKFLSRR